jgi:YfiH family protein
VTDEPGTYLWLGFADCTPVLLYDPIQRAIGLAHAGWRGTVGHVVARTVEAMLREFGTRPADLLAGIGPAIGPCCYQVGPEVASAVRTAFPDDPDLLTPDGSDRMRLNLPGANARLLTRLGVPAEQVELSDLCTACRTDLCFSHRAEAGRTGRLAAVIGLRM